MTEKRFRVKETQHILGSIIRIIVDLDTGVNYLVTFGFGLNGVTPLLDSSGKVIITKE